MRKRRFAFASLLLVLPWCSPGRCEPVTSAPAAAIASGRPLWVDSQLDPGDWLINARVDLGSLLQSGDAIEAKVAWPLSLGTLIDVRAAHPGVAIPDGSTLIDTEHIVCRENGPLSYRVGSEIISPDGKSLERQVFNAEEARAKAAAYEETSRWSHLSDSRMRQVLEGYHPGWDALVCWAVARKCEGTEYRWPPPPNKMPLEYSERALKMRLDYDRPFIPHCRL
jgi:hypothetical protein